ncbi:MAG: ABC transporter ATP-binding protein [Oscillospiraceae bacterium]|nr:ABC transporter ATP-binding protein [Oscillospiraceae bacterium]
MKELLQVNKLCVSYGKIPVVQDVSLHLKAGEIAGLVGESGCGKSTLLRALMMLNGDTAHVTGGSILFLGQDLVQMNEEALRQLRGDQISMIFQDCGEACDPVKTIGYQFWETMNSHGKKYSKRECNAQASDLLRQLRMPEPERILKSYPFELSGGMNQRVGIALAMINHPKLLLADEPTSALDVTVQMQVLRQLHDLRNTYQTAMLIVTHSMGVAAQLCDLIGVMYAGHLVEWGPCGDVLAHPAHPYTKALIGAIPQGDGQDLVGIPGRTPDFSQEMIGCPYGPRCPYAAEDCHREMPAEQTRPNGHWVRCCHPLDQEEL